MRKPADTRPSALILGERLREAETALVATAVYARSTAAAMVGTVDASGFRQEPLKLIWQAIDRLVRDGVEVTELELIASGLDMANLDALRGMEFDVAGSESGEACVKVWRAALAAMRAHQVLGAGQAALARAAFTGRGILEATSGLGAAVGAVVEEVAVERGAETMCDAMAAFVRDTRAGSARQVVGSWGLPELDERLGSLRAGTMSVVCAFPGHGKSTFGVQASRATAKQGRRVLYVTTEMLRGELAMRVLCAEERQNPRSLERSIKAGEGVADDIAAWARNIVPEDRVRGIDAIAAKCRAAKLQGHPYSVVVLDYLQMLDGPGEREYDRLTYIAYRIKQLALDEDIAAVVMAQVNRSADHQTAPSMRTLRGSSAIEDAADAILAVYRMDAEDRLAAKSYELKLSVEKARNGQPGLLRYQLLMGYGTFDLWQPDYPPESHAEVIR